jgi:hypothetical protein
MITDPHVKIKIEQEPSRERGLYCSYGLPSCAVT